ncbi:uncharacterized protein LOC141939970 [Strix uralensis]|uniref:uncharacterized protein LOC141939970 n=1 Tax=Strix uralensis TaxID=36305 RepID=UPI003DA6F75A
MWAAPASQCRKREPASLGEEGALFTVRSRPGRQRAPRVCVRHPKRGGGQPGDWIFRRRRGAGGRKEKEASDPSNSPGSAESESCDDLQEFPSHLKPFCSSGVTAVTSRAVSYHRREKVAPGFKAIPSACCFTPAAALLKKRRRKLWLTKLCHNRDCSRQHHGMLIMTSTGLAVLSFFPAACNGSAVAFDLRKKTLQLEMEL